MREDELAESAWEPIGARLFGQAWAADAEEIARTPKTQTVYMATGLLLPFWNRIGDEEVRVTRIAAVNDASVLGRELSAKSAAKLAEAFGLPGDIRPPASELAKSVLAGGGSAPVWGHDELTLKRSRVGADWRLEIIGFDPARLPWYKAKGCFTEIIRYKTRLFVPADRGGRGGRRYYPRPLNRNISPAEAGLP